MFIERKQEKLLISAIYISKKEKKTDKCLVIVTVNEAGYGYGFLKEDSERGR